jgi:hypothetical protein
MAADGLWRAWGLFTTRKKNAMTGRVCSTCGTTVGLGSNQCPRCVHAELAARYTASLAPETWAAAQAQYAQALQAMQGLAYIMPGTGPGAPIMPARKPKPLDKADMAGPLRAWRIWRVWRVMREGHLFSITQNTRWEPGRPLRSSYGPPRAHGSDGIYAVKARDFPFDDYGAAADFAFGEVALWGGVVEHERGYRAEYAYPLRLIWTAPCVMPGFPRAEGAIRFLRDIAELYGVPLTVER